MPNFKKQPDTVPIDRPTVPIGAKAAAYLQLKAQVKQLLSQIEELRPALEEYLDKHKTIDVNDSQYVRVQHQGKTFELVNTAIKRESLFGDAIKIIEEDPAFDDTRDELLEEMIELRTDRIAELILHDRLSEQDVLKFMKVETGYAFKVKRVG